MYRQLLSVRSRLLSIRLSERVQVRHTSALTSPSDRSLAGGQTLIPPVGMEQSGDETTEESAIGFPELDHT